MFGNVLAGMEIVDRIESAATGTRMLISRGPDGTIQPAAPNQNVPLKDVMIETVTLVK